MTLRVVITGSYSEIRGVNDTLIKRFTEGDHWAPAIDMAFELVKSYEQAREAVKKATPIDQYAK